MSYSDFFLKKEKKIPFPFLLLSVLAIIVVLARLMGSSPLPSRASKNTIANVAVVNLTATTGGIYWETIGSVKSWIVMGEESTVLTSRIYDERDVADNIKARRLHFAPLKELKQGKTYYFVISVQDEKSIFLVKDRNENPYVFTTPSEMVSIAANKPAYGKVVNQNNSSAVDALVRLTVGSAYSQMTFTKSTGEWLIPLSSLIDVKSNKPMLLKNDDPVTINIYSENGSTNINTIVSKMSPLPQTIILGKDYTFNDENNVLAATDISSSSESSEVSILSPNEQAIIPGNTLLVRGVARPNTQVFVLLKRVAEVQQIVTTDNSGMWRVSFSGPLQPGEYTITVKTKNAKNQDISLLRTITIAKSGEQVLGSATDSATPTVIVSPTVAIPSPTTIYNVYPSVTPYSATSSATPPVTGGSGILPWILSAGGILIIGMGIILAF